MEKGEKVREGGGVGRKRGKEEEMGACRGEERPGKMRARFLGWVEREKTLEELAGTGSGK